MNYKISGRLEKVRENLGGLGFDDDFLGTTFKA